MKKLLLTLFIGAMAYSATAQQDLPAGNVESVVKVNDDIQLKMPALQSMPRYKADKTISAWYNYNDALSSYFIGISGYSPFLAQDTFYRNPLWDPSGITGWDTVTWNSVGNAFDPSDPTYDFDSDDLTEAFPRGISYTVDSVSIPYFYYAPDTSVVDTLVLQFWYGAPASNGTIESWYIAQQGQDTNWMATVQYDINTGLGKGATKTIKYPLTQADTSTVTFGNLQIGIPGGITVAANNLLAATMTFVSGDTNLMPWDTFAGPFNYTPQYFNSFRFLMTTDASNNITGHYNNGLLIRSGMRHRTNWFQSPSRSPRYLTSQAFVAYQYPNIYYKVTATVSSPQAPADLTAVSTKDAKVMLSWKDNSSTEIGYRIYRSDNGNQFSEIMETEANVISYTDANVTEGTNYQYKVVAFNNAGESAESNVAQVTPVGIEEIVGGVSALAVYPNPARESLTLHIGLQSADNVNIVIADITGKEISATAAKLAAGGQNMTIDISNLESGVYMASVKTSTGSRTVRFMVSE